MTNEEDKILSYFHHLSQARQYADTEGQKLIEHELKRTRERYRRKVRNKGFHHIKP